MTEPEPEQDVEPTEETRVVYLDGDNGEIRVVESEDDEE